jgi:hypothetical protein
MPEPHGLSANRVKQNVLPQTPTHMYKGNRKSIRYFYLDYDENKNMHWTPTANNFKISSPKSSTIVSQGNFTQR